MLVFDDEYFMGLALKEAEQALEEGEVPVGAVIVSQDKVIAKSRNQTELLKDSTAHAEMLAITSATNQIGSKYLKDCTLYVTLEPCVMCIGASYWSQLGRIVYGARDEKRGYRVAGEHLSHPKTEIVSGVLAPRSEELLHLFFTTIRKKKGY